MSNATRLLCVLTFIGGGFLAVTGIKFVMIPEHAARVFGIARATTGFELHHVIAGRDIWLGLLAIAFAALKEWRALALWFGLGVFVCLADAAIVLEAGGKSGRIVFHLGSALLCIVLAAMAWRAHRMAGRA